MISPYIANIIADMAADIDEEYMFVIRHVTRNWDKFVKWPSVQNLYFPAIHRMKATESYPSTIYDEHLTKMQERNIKSRKWTNDPAAIAYQLSSDVYPKRQKKASIHWHVRHIYDGQFPWTSNKVTLHAVKSGDHFTHSAGLVAIHPIADALADEFGYFAWLLRAEAYERFGYDPDNIFSSSVYNPL
ncbi:hypothetical protein CLV58_12366 [Spirosoma oryzae]|uniref:Uncharacterized protein n=1 Tax=Spirosoma oryzae TaxID=1469603 RepID=A0A2T0SCQ2_9BACT|nr:hypothetical protein [Spirosoma oryzae]PRY31103.1 hypothetical protein CLV58_12366 [Spirosoma oryzae]